MKRRWGDLRLFDFERTLGFLRVPLLIRALICQTDGPNMPDEAQVGRSTLLY